MFRAVLASGGAKSKDIPKQLKIPRPNATEVETRAPTEEELLTFFAPLRAVEGS